MTDSAFFVDYQHDAIWIKSYQRDHLLLLDAIEALRIRDEEQRLAIVRKILKPPVSVSAAFEEVASRLVQYLATQGQQACCTRIPSTFKWRIVLPGMSIHDDLVLPLEFPQPVLALAPLDFTIKNPTSILSSRKPRLFDPKASWLEGIRLAVREANNAEVTLVSSIGTIPYDLVTRFADREGRRLILILPSGPIPTPQGVSPRVPAKYGDLTLQQSHLFICVNLWKNLQVSKQELMQRRDLLVASLATTITGIGIRRGGSFERLLNQRKDNARIRIEIVPEPEVPRVKRRGQASLLAHRVPADLPWRCNDHYLFHYTRAHPGSWPGQAYEEYLDSVLGNDSGAAHTGFDALVRILTNRRINGSGKLIKHNLAVVCFTELAPDELVTKPKWSRHLIRWEFEPYGLAITREYAQHCGIRPVIYAPTEDYETIKQDARYLFQLHNPPLVDWSAERELRLLGDFDFAAAPQTAVVGFVPTQQEATLLSKYSPWRVVALTSA